MRPAIPDHLLSLVRKELIRPERSTRPQDEAFRFRHLLIRDAAYDSLPKETRAELHERFAAWLEGHGQLIELEEIVGYHLEQAHRNRVELDPSDPRCDDLANRAAEMLYRAARKASAQGVITASLGLLERSVGLLPKHDPRRFNGLIDLIDPLCQVGRIDDARAAVAELDQSGDARYRAYAGLLGCLINFYAGQYERDETQARIDAARMVLVEFEDELGLAYAELVQAGMSWAGLRAEETRSAATRGTAHAGRARAEHLVLELSGWQITPLVHGPIHVEEALQLADAALEGAAGSPLLEARLWSIRGRLLSICGDADGGRELVRAGVQTARDAGLLVDAAAGALARNFVELHAGDLEAAAQAARDGAEELERLGDRGYRSTMLLMLANVLVMQGAYEEAGRWCGVARAMSAPDDLVNFANADLLEGFLLTLHGDQLEGERIVRRGVELCERTDFYFERGRAQELLAQTLAVVGRKEEAREAAERAVAIFAAKGDQPLAALARRLVEEVAVSV